MGSRTFTAQKKKSKSLKFEYIIKFEMFDVRGLRLQINLNFFCQVNATVLSFVNLNITLTIPGYICDNIYFTFSTKF